MVKLMEAKKQAKYACFDLLVRPQVIFAWLKMLKTINPHYHDIVIDESEKMVKTLLDLHNQLIDEAEIIDEKHNDRANEMLRQVDVAEVRVFSDEIHNDDDEEVQVTLSHLLLSSKPDVMGSENYIEMLHDCLCNDDKNNNDHNDIDSDENESDIDKTDNDTKIYNANVPLKITKKKEPMNEFGENDIYLQTLFPTLFILGRFGNGCTGQGTLQKITLPLKLPICKIMARRASWSNCNCTNIIIYLLGNFLTSQRWVGIFVLPFFPLYFPSNLLDIRYCW